MNARVTYNTNGSVGPFTITFPYISESDVVVRLDDVVQTVLTDYTFSSATEITLVDAPSETEIELRRSTQIEPYIDFSDAGVVVETDLDTAFLQSLYIALEAEDTATLAATGISDAATDTELAAEAATRLAADNLEIATRAAAVTAEAVARVAADAFLQTEIDDLVAGSGTVPTPANPGDDGKFLGASGGLYDWLPVVASIASTDITDSTAIGRTILTAANAAAVVAALGTALNDSHTHVVANISDSSANMRSLIQAATYLAARIQLFDAPVAVTVTNTSHFLINAALGSSFTMVPGVSFTLDNPTNPTHGQRLFIRIKQDSGGGRVLTLDTAWRLGADISTVVLSTAANKVDYIGAVYDSTDLKWDIIAFEKGY